MALTRANLAPRIHNKRLRVVKGSNSEPYLMPPATEEPSRPMRKVSVKPPHVPFWKGAGFWLGFLSIAASFAIVWSVR